MRCEARLDSGKPCLGHAAFWVTVGSREADGQHSCRRHLAATVTALLGNEMRPGVVVTVRFAR